MFTFSCGQNTDRRRGIKVVCRKKRPQGRLFYALLIRQVIEFAQKKEEEAMTTRYVVVYEENSILQVNPHRLYVRSGDVVKWLSNEGVQLYVKNFTSQGHGNLFSGSNGPYTIPANGHVDSGAVVAAPSSGTGAWPYNYTVADTSKKLSVDPVIIVDPPGNPDTDRQ